MTTVAKLIVEIRVPDDAPKDYYEAVSVPSIAAEIYDTLKELEDNLDLPRVTLETLYADGKEILA